MVLNIILAICIPLSLLVMGLIVVKLINSILDYAIKVQEMEEQKIKPPVLDEEVEESGVVLTHDVLNEYLNGTNEM